MPTQAEIIQAVLAFINAETWAESKKIVQTNTTLLLTGQAEQLLANWLAQSHSNEQATRRITECRALLARCRVEGIEVVFADHCTFPFIPHHRGGVQTAEVSKTSAVSLNDLPVLINEITILTRPNDMPQRIELCHIALSLVDQNSHPQLWAWLQLNLANSFNQNPLGNVAENQEQAIIHYQQALRVYDRQAFAEQWAATQNNLANAYQNRIREEQAENLEQAIYHYQQALGVFTQQNFPEQWAAAQNNLANAYQNRIHRERRENLEKEIYHYQQALKVYTRQAFPEDWAMTQSNLTTAYVNRIEGDREENLEQAIYHSQQALEVFTRQAFPEQWAMTQNNLATTYRDRIREERAENLEKAIFHYQQALIVLTQQAFPERWARIQHNLAAVYTKRIQSEQVETLEKVIYHYQQALKVYTRQAFPEDWAIVQNNLGQTYRNRIQGGQAENLEQAIVHYQQALTVFTRQAFPEQWATIHSNLGETYRSRIWKERAESLEQAIYHYQQALEVYTRQAFPEQWAMMQNNLGVLYIERLREERAWNLERAIYHCQQALEVRTPQNFPEQWAMTQNNLANAYSQRIQGERAENLEQAITHCQQALTVFTRQAFPERWADIQHNLGAVYRSRIRGEQAENLEQAIYHYQQALAIFIRQDFPVDWAITQNNLAVVYSIRIQGERRKNLEQAIACFQRALEVSTQQEFPERWAMTQNNLASIYIDRIEGEREENLEQTISHCQQALSVFTRQTFPEQWAITQNNLGNAYYYRIQGERRKNLQKAISHYEKALEIGTRQAFPEQWAMRQRNLALAYEALGQTVQAIQHYKQSLEVYRFAIFPHDCRNTSLGLGHLYFEQHYWQEAYQAYQPAMQATKILLASAFTDVGRQVEVGEVPQLYACATYALLQLGHYTQALEQLEQGKTRLLAQALALVEVDARHLPEEQQQAFQAKRQVVRDLQIELRLSDNLIVNRQSKIVNRSELAHQLEQATTDLSQLIQTIRQDHPDFMPTDLATHEILALIPPHGALVAPLVTSQGSAVFVLPYGLETITADHILWLASFTRDDLQTLLIGSEANPGWFHAYLNRRSDPTSWFMAIETTTGQLWELLMGPIQQKLMELGVQGGDSQSTTRLASASHLAAPPIILMPQGRLGLLPLHAAWREIPLSEVEQGLGGKVGRRAFLDDYTVTYAPSAYALSVSHRRVKESQRQSVTLLAIVNPTADLVYAAVEGESMAAFFDPASRYSLVEGQATKSAILQHAPGRTYFHFAGHGFYDWHEVMRSGLLVAGGDSLTLAEVISHLDLSAARLVALSACETGLTEFQQSPDEFIGLPAGFLQAGASGVLSTLWLVEDRATSLLIECFYRHHRQEGQAPAAALRAAQLWLRNASRKELGDYYKSFFLTRIPANEAQTAWYEIGDGAPGEKPYDHPFFWAAFTFTGI